MLFHRLFFWFTPSTTHIFFLVSIHNSVYICPHLYINITQPLIFHVVYSYSAWSLFLPWTPALFFKTMLWQCLIFLWDIEFCGLSCNFLAEDNPIFHLVFFYSYQESHFLNSIKKCAPDLTHWGWDKMAANFLTAFSNAFSWMSIYKFGLRFH